MPDLPDVAADLAAIAKYHTVLPVPPLIDIVTSADVNHEIAKLETAVDAIYIATHGDVGRILLSNDSYVGTDDLAYFLRQSGATLCILNVCQAESLAYRVFYAAQVDVMYAKFPIADREASIWIVRMSRALYDNEGYAEAFKQAGDAGGRYGFLSAKGVVVPNTPGGAIDRLTQQVYSLETALTVQIKVLEERSRAQDALVQQLVVNNAGTQKLIETLERSNSLNQQQLVDQARNAADLKENAAKLEGKLTELALRVDNLRVPSVASPGEGRLQIVISLLMFLLVAFGLWYLGRGGG